MGDVDVVYHEGIYHLFHLVLPNHDFIAHAVSDDGFYWSRVENALFIGHPGSWDDSMLWTMHVTPDPHNAGRWRMFYTGLSLDDNGLVQRVGMATSSDLYEWTKAPVNWVSRCERCRLTNLPASNHTAKYDMNSHYPLASVPPHYESTLDEGRRWISWRDPFFFQDNGQGWLLIAGRAATGPVTRRGAVAVLKEVGANEFAPRPSLFHPSLYDDIEVPNLLKLDGQYYLLGSIREDAKIRYWHTDEIGKPWKNYSDNVLLPKGNYAGRTCFDDKGLLIWNFFSHDVSDRTSRNSLPPPKRIVRRDDGQLRVVSFEGFDQRVKQIADGAFLHEMERLIPNDHGTVTACPESHALKLSNEAGFQGFLFNQEVSCFRFHCILELEGTGKCGLVFRIDPETQDGYYLSLDLIKGVAQVRAWGTDHDATGERMMQFNSLQAGYWRSTPDSPHVLTLIAFGSYLELSVNGRVVLSLADATFQRGRLGIYAESARLDVTEIRLEHLRSPNQADDALAGG